MNGLRRRRWWLAAALLFAAAGTCAICPCCAPFVETFRARRFDAAEWRAGSELDRGRMVHDLTRSGRLDRLTRAEVVALLGEPDSADDAEIGYRVDIGNRLGSKQWLYGLHIEFDRTVDRVKAVSIRD